MPRSRRVFQGTELMALTSVMARWYMSALVFLLLKKIHEPPGWARVHVRREKKEVGL